MGLTQGIQPRSKDEGSPQDEVALKPHTAAPRQAWSKPPDWNRRIKHSRKQNETDGLYEIFKYLESNVKGAKQIR